MSDAAKLGKIFIGGLSYETTDEKLRAYFGAYGAVTDAVVMKDPISRRSRGFGFITYADPACVDRALAQPTHILDSRRVEAKRAVPRAESLRDVGSSPSSSRGNGSLASINISSAIGATKKIFVGGLHYETKDGDFKKYFMQYGKVVSAEVMFNRETNKSRGFGFVIFESEGSVEVVLQEKNHVIDGKSVEVKRAVPRTDVPPPRSVSSRAGSFSGPGGPGSVGSLDDLSCSTTPPVSLSGSVSSLNHFSSDGRTALMGNGTLVGYAAAVRYGSRGVPKGPAPIPSSVGSPTPPMMNGDALNGSMGLDASTLDGVAEALSSLVLGEPGKASSSIASPLHSATSSHGSSDKLNAVGGAASVGGLSPLDVALSPLADPVMEQWKLSPVSTARGSSSDMTSLSASETSYLSHGLLDEDANGSSSAHMAWQTSSWQQPWHSPQLRHQPPKDSSQQPSLQPQSLYAMFPSSSSQSTLSGPGSSWGSSGVGYNTPHSHDSTSPPANRFGNGLMGMDMPQMVDTSFRGPPLGNGFGVQSDVNGNGFGMQSDVNSNGFGMQSDVNGNGFGVQRDVNGNGVGRYGPLGGGLFSPEYLPPDSRPSFGSSGGVIGSSRNVPEEDDESPRDKNDQDLAYDLPASAAEYHRQFR